MVIKIIWQKKNIPTSYDKLKNTPKDHMINEKQSSRRQIGKHSKITWKKEVPRSYVELENTQTVSFIATSPMWPSLSRASLSSDLCVGSRLKKRKNAWRQRDLRKRHEFLIGLQLMLWQHKLESVSGIHIWYVDSAQLAYSGDCSGAGHRLIERMEKQRANRDVCSVTVFWTRREGCSSLQDWYSGEMLLLQIMLLKQTGKATDKHVSLLINSGLLVGPLRIMRFILSPILARFLNSSFSMLISCHIEDHCVAFIWHSLLSLQYGSRMLHKRYWLNVVMYLQVRQIADEATYWFGIPNIGSVLKSLTGVCVGIFKFFLLLISFLCPSKVNYY